MFRSGADCVVSIKNQGEGISPEVLPKLFKKTEHVTTYGTNGEKGTGLGLNLCKGYVEANKGRIWIENEFGKGCTLHFSLPSPSEAA